MCVPADWISKFHVSLYTTLEDVNIKALVDDADSEVGGKMLDF